MTRFLRYSFFGALFALGACTTLPSGPSVLALPGAGKSFDQFRADDLECQQYANAQVGGMTSAQVAADSGIKSAAVGATVGAATGAAIDGVSGAATGAGAGLLVGTAAGTGSANASSYELQRRYDFGYIQCMYARGHKVPIPGEFTSAPAGKAPPPAPPPSQPPS